MLDQIMEALGNALGSIPVIGPFLKIIIPIIRKVLKIFGL
ncbi:hypothetical protein HNR67_004847 [Crossiella cryophila]|uniref:Uncharacterized protein n=1 Tax=Crossiella cryophila TaxID=43355 RepID=A0A7W7FXB4_9PSEU|nr:hypothetical protein [Crossiella cryophila]